MPKFVAKISTYAQTDIGKQQWRGQSSTMPQPRIHPVKKLNPLPRLGFMLQSCFDVRKFHLLRSEGREFSLTARRIFN